jgi:hypothetical protein
MPLPTEPIARLVARFLLAFTLFSVVSVSTHAGDPDQLALNNLFGEETVSQNLERVRTRTDHLEPTERYPILISWVLPSETHSSIRLNGRFLDRREHERELYCPAVELINVASQLEEIAALRRRVLKLSDSLDRDQHRALNSLLFLIDSKSSESTDSAAADSRQLLKLMLDGTIEREFQAWPETVACWVGLQDPQNWTLVADLVTEVYLRTIEKKISATDTWREQVAAMHGLLLHLQNGGTASSFVAPPELKHWMPADLVTHRDWDQVYPLSHWQWEENALRNLASGPQSVLFYKFPLRGNFEVSCELPALAMDDIQLMYGGEFLFPDANRRTIHIGSVKDTRTDSNRINPPLTKPHDWTWCRMTVRDHVCSTFFNGRLVRRRPAHPGHAPWLVIRVSSSLRHPAVRNLRIDGEPVIPSAVNLIAERSLSGWRSPESARGDVFRFWKYVDDERGTGLTSIPNDDNPASAYESLMQYYRPLAEGESFEYEFFYGTGSQPAHPVIDDVFTTIKPQGIALRRTADESPNSEFIEHRGLLKQDDWNLCRLSVRQNQVQLILNGQLIHSFPLRDDRPPLIGFYREAGQRSVRVRNVVWRSEETLAFDTLESQFVNQVPRSLPVDTTGWDVIEHDFSREGFPTDYFSTPSGRESIPVTRSNDGLLHSVKSGDDWDNSDLQPYFSLHGDFEIVLEFDKLQISEQAHGGCGIVLSNDDGRLIQFTRRERSANEHRVLLTLRSPLRNRQVMTSESLIASEATSGRFRVVRQADTYHFSFAEADSDVFRTVAEETIEGAGETPDRFDIRMLAHRNTTARVLWKRLRVASEMIDQSRFVASGDVVTEEQWALIETSKETLRELVLDGTQISDDDLARLKDHTGLKTLWLKSTPITSQGVRHLEKLTQLESLHLTGSNVDDDVGETLKKLTNLSSVGLSITRAGDKTAESLSQLPHLQRIGLSRTAVTDDAIESLSQIESPRLINLQRTNVSEAAIDQLKKALPKCDIRY